MDVGLYFGSFNPIHVGHLIIANHILNNSSLQQVWFVVSPQNPFKNSNSLLNEYHRLHLVNLAIDEDPRIKASDIEFKLPRPSYTIDTLIYLQEKYPTYRFSVIMGSDSFQNIHKWKNADLLLKNYNFIIYPRPGFSIEDKRSNITALNAPLIEISATEIRKIIRDGKSARYLIPEKALQEIEKNRYYR